MPPQIVLTCEHGGNEIPPELRHLFAGAEEVLQSHRGWDPGTLELAARFKDSLDAPLFSATITRLLVDLNRSLGHRRLFSEYLASLTADDREQILEEYYHPHRKSVTEMITDLISRRERVIHLALHSFTPVLNGEVRNAEIGLLYDPRRKWEKSLCEQWRKAILQAAPELRVRRNYPYLGSADGLTTALRKLFPDHAVYAGIELEVNQKCVLESPESWSAMQGMLVETFREITQTNSTNPGQ